jgi:hypothetical protein
VSQVRILPGPLIFFLETCRPEKAGYLGALKPLRHHMIMFGLGYGDRIRAIAFTTLRNRYPEDYEAFRKGFEQ